MDDTFWCRIADHIALVIGERIISDPKEQDAHLNHLIEENIKQTRRLLDAKRALRTGNVDAFFEALGEE